MSTAATPKTKKPLHKSVWVWVLAALALFAFIGAVFYSEDAPEVETKAAATQEDKTPEPTTEEPTTEEPAQETTEEPAEETTEEPTTEPEPEPAVPEVTVAQENAIRSAESYVGVMPFSRQGLIDQLTSEYGSGYDLADAEFAVAYLEDSGAVDWNAEAVEAAESYLNTMGFSRQGLIDQLTSPYGSQFTRAQAEQAVDAVGL